jgi:4-hydroxy-tetrahydrodipicolinate synthase
MTAPFRPEGLLVPVVTPFDEAGHVDEAALEQHCKNILSAGAVGIVAVATTAESSSLTDDEREAVIGICIQACEALGAVLVVGAGTYNTRETIARHEALANLPSVRASLAVVPYYVRPSEAAIVAHFRAVAEHSPVPVIVYNIPYRTACGLGAGSLLELSCVDNIVGVKQAVGGIDVDTLRLLAEAPAEFAVLGGDDAFLLPLLAMGGAGAIAASANVATERYAAMIEAALASDVVEARTIAEALLPLTLSLFAEPSPAVIKAVLHALGKIPTAHVRMPLADASSAAVEQALATLASIQSSAAAARPLSGRAGP